MEAFRGFVACSYDTYAKPKSAGLKVIPPSEKRRAQLPEPEQFSERTTLPACKKVAVSPLVISQVGKEAEWKVQPKKDTRNLELLDPDRISRKQFVHVSRLDNKRCPKSVQSCEQCRVAFQQADIILVKTVGVRERTDKSGKLVKYTGNVYLHFLTKCLKEFFLNSKFSAVTVQSKTLKFLPDGSRENLEAKWLKVEYDEEQ